MSDKKKEIEDLILMTWVSGKVELLEPYHGELAGSEPYYFRWAESQEGALVFFKPRVTSMKVLLSWLNNEGVIDVQMHKQTTFAATMMGSNLPIQEICILFSKADAHE